MRQKLEQAEYVDRFQNVLSHFLSPASIVPQ